MRKREMWMLWQSWEGDASSWANLDCTEPGYETCRVTHERGLIHWEKQRYKGHTVEYF